MAYGGQHALVVGVDNYLDPGLPDLQYAVSDADAVASMLINRYRFPAENVTVLKNESATRTRILKEMERFVSDPEIEEDSQFLFFFAGHGETIRDQIGFILPHDVDLSNLIASGIRMNEVGDVARALRPKHALFLMDACYGGLTALRSNPQASVMFKNALASKARQIITAGSSNEQVIEAADYQHSAFTYALLDALDAGAADGNNDGIITALELATKIQYDVPFYADVHGGKQTPQYTKLTPDAGDFLFIRESGALYNIDLMNEQVIESNQDEIAKSFQKRLRIHANVDNARIFIDDSERGYLTDKEVILPLAAGFYTVGIKKDQYEDASKELVISPRDSVVSVEFNLKSTHTAVHFDIEPADAIVYVDADYLGAGAFWEDIPKGRKRFEVTKEGYVPSIRTVNVTQDTLKYVVRLDRITASLNLTSIPFGALVLSNYTDTLGVTPLRNVTVPYGDHVLTLHKEGYDEYRVPLEVKESIGINRTVEMTESAEVVARRIVNRQRAGKIKDILVSSAVGAGAYVGYGYLNGEVQKLDKDDSNHDPYYYGQYVALGMAGSMGISVLAKLIQFALIDYDKELDKELQRRAKAQIALGYDGRTATVAMHIRF